MISHLMRDIYLGLQLQGQILQDSQIYQQFVCIFVFSLFQI